MPCVGKGLHALQQEINAILHGFSDCSVCGLCCKDEEVVMTKADVSRVAQMLQMDPASFLQYYTHFNGATNETILNLPCPFLQENRCRIYPVRPEVCRKYPIFVLEDEGLVLFSDLELCAKATQFHEAFLDFLSEYFPSVYEYAMKNFYARSANKRIDAGKVRNALYSIDHIRCFIDWFKTDEAL
jgi:Fe-S-cluster containining protein